METEQEISEELKATIGDLNARITKLEAAIRQIMLKWSDAKLCSKIAMEALSNK